MKFSSFSKDQSPIDVTEFGIGIEDKYEQKASI